MFQKLRTAVYHVSDLAAAKEWYRKATGTDPYFDEPFYVGFDINGCELGLDPDLSGFTPGTTAQVYWAVEDANKAVARLTEMGATLVQDVTNVGGPTYVAVVADPFGNPIGLIAGA